MRRCRMAATADAGRDRGSAPGAPLVLAPLPLAAEEAVPARGTPAGMLAPEAEAPRAALLPSRDSLWPV